MDRENALSTIASFDTELYTFFQEELQRQKYTLSFMPEENYSSPLSTYLEGSILSNTLTTHHDEAKPTGLEEITINRINKLFGSEHAVIRLESIAAASRVVFYSLAKKGDTILSLDNRKSDHCNSKNLEFISLMLVYNLFFTVLLFSFVFVFLKPFTYFLAQLGNQIRMLICDIILFELILFHII